jgi:hypothetical protein
MLNHNIVSIILKKAHKCHCWHDAIKDFCFDHTTDPDDYRYMKQKLWYYSCWHSVGDLHHKYYFRNSYYEWYYLTENYHNSLENKTLYIHKLPNLNLPFVYYKKLKILNSKKKLAI